MDTITEHLEDIQTTLVNFNHAAGEAAFWNFDKRPFILSISSECPHELQALIDATAGAVGHKYRIHWLGNSLMAHRKPDIDFQDCNGVRAKTLRFYPQMKDPQHDLSKVWGIAVTLTYPFKELAGSGPYWIGMRFQLLAPRGVCFDSPYPMKPSDYAFQS